MELVILSGGAAHGLVSALAPAFEAETGCRIAGTYGAVGAMRDRLTSGARADLVILTAPLVAELERQGHVRPGTACDIGVVHTGIAVREGDAIPDFGSATALREALRAATDIYFPDPELATAGIHVGKILRQLGLTSELAARLRPHPNGAAAMGAMATQAGGRPIGCTQITEILATPGVALAGRLPHEFELATTYACAVAARAQSPELAAQLAERLCSRASIAVREQLGFSMLA